MPWARAETRRRDEGGVPVDQQADDRRPHSRVFRFLLAELEDLLIGHFPGGHEPLGHQWEVSGNAERKGDVGLALR